jgi:hypothetical protein
MKGDEKMTAAANIPTLVCFGISLACLWMWLKLTIAQREKGEEDERNLWP